MAGSVTTESATPTTNPAARPAESVAFAVLTGLTSLAVLLQAVWAGIFLEHDGARDAASTWIDVHARGADVAIALAAITTVFAFVRLRSRKDLWIGSLLLTLVLVLESYVGGLIVDDSKNTLTAVHIPLGMAIMALAVWIPLRARQFRSQA